MDSSEIRGIRYEYRCEYFSLYWSVAGVLSGFLSVYTRLQTSHQLHIDVNVISDVILMILYWVKNIFNLVRNEANDKVGNWVEFIRFTTKSLFDIIS